MIFPPQCNQTAPKAEQLVYNLLKSEFGDSNQISVFHEVRLQSTRERNREYERKERMQKREEAEEERKERM